MNLETVKSLNGKLISNKHYRWVVNMFPKFEGHTLVIPKRHITNLEDESDEEIFARNKLIKTAAANLRKLYPGSGIEIFIQTGEGSEASIAHLHWHVVPALPSDQLRGFDKLGHFFTMEPDKEKVVIFPIKIEKAQKTLLKALSKTLGRKATNESSRNGGRQRHAAERHKGKKLQ